MKKYCVVILPFLLILFAQTASHPTDKDMAFLHIDSGTKEIGYYNNVTWQGDNPFIHAGESKLIEPKIDVPGYMKTLLYFPKGKKNCYNLALDHRYKFLFRAGFYYANHDGLSNPPTFDLLLAGKLWETVDTSLSEDPLYYEIVYKPKGKKISVCLVRSRDGEIPFISSLEALALNETNGMPVYGLMGSNTALRLVSRNRFGSFDEVAGPPASAIAPPNASSSISLQVNFATNTTQSAYFVFYFKNLNQPSWTPNDTRKLEIHVNGVLQNLTDIQGNGPGHAVTLYPVTVKDVANVTISSANDTAQAPFLSAMEAFVASELVEMVAQMFPHKYFALLLFILILVLLYEGKKE